MNFGYQNRSWSDHFTELYPEFLTLSDYAVKTVTFVVTTGCNLDCTYCYEVHKGNERLSLETAKKFIDMFLTDEEITEPGVILDFIGGEPLLEIDLIDQIMDYFRFRAFQLKHRWLKCYMISMSTNGILYLDPRVQRFIKKNEGRVSMSITIDGTKEAHDMCRVDALGNGSYDRVYEAIKAQMERNPHVQTKVTFSPNNITRVAESILHLYSIGISGVHANPVYEEGWELEHAQIFYKELIKLADAIIDNELYIEHDCSLFEDSIGKDAPDDKNWCGGDATMLAVGPDGKLFPCLRFMPMSMANDRPSLNIGTVDTGIDRECENFKLLRSLTKTSQSPEKCLTCPVASGCGWCSGYNYDYYGTPNKRATFICDMHKARCLAAHYYFSKLYEKFEMDEEFPLNLSAEDIARIKGDLQ